MNASKLVRIIGVFLGFASVLAAGAYLNREWLTRQNAGPQEESPRRRPLSDGTPPVRVSLQARKNMELTSAAIQPTHYFRVIELPGLVTDRPGVSDRGVVAPITGIITQIHAYPGHRVPPNSPLFTLRLVSESLHISQLELFKATREIELAKQQNERLEGLAATGGIAGARLIEIENQLQRLDVNVQAYRQDLLARGLPQDRIDAAAEGQFATEFLVSAPGEETASQSAFFRNASSRDEPQASPFSYELQSLNVALGQQVEAGTVLCHLSDHRALLIEGRGFKKDLALIQNAARQQLPIEVTFETSDEEHWPPLAQPFQIEHVANLIDAATRTFAFYLPLENQYQIFEQEGQKRFLWHFRPGDRVRLRVAVERLENVFVLPQAAIVRDGPEAYVFRQNGDLFDRISVHVVHEDRLSVVIANDGRLRKGSYLAQNAAATLQRVLRAQLASGQPTNVHVHADGTVHEDH